MDIFDELNRRKAQAGQRISDMFTPPKKPENWFEQLKGVQQNAAVATPDDITKAFEDALQRMDEGLVPPMIRERERAMRTDPSAAAKPFTSQEIKQATPFVTAAAPIAYHGTPHNIPKNDAGKIVFDSSKIGTGQGAQSYGHGLYFAENPEVAKTYAPMDRTWQQIKSGGAPRGGNTYQVNIPDQHAARMLDWDKPLSEQPEILESLKRLPIPTQAMEQVKYEKMTGKAVYKFLSDLQMNYKEHGWPGQIGASDMLKDAGIPGIKYLDQGSREAGAGTRNFVVFDPAILQDVTKK